MNKIWLIIQREFLNRVQKKSFLIATIILPLIFPAIVAVLLYVAIQQERNADKKVVHYIDESNTFIPDTSKFVFEKLNVTIEGAIEEFDTVNNAYTLLYIPRIDLANPRGISLHSKTNLNPSDINTLENMLERSIRTIKMNQLNIDQKILDSLETTVNIKTIIHAEDGQSKLSNSEILAYIGSALGFLMYMFIFIYGAQIMQGIIEEKTSKVVEIIVSSVKPFQLMMGKIIGLASVGLLQFLIWILLITAVSSFVLAYFGLQMPQQQVAEQMSQQYGAAQNQGTPDFLEAINQVSFTSVIFTFLFYFIGGYLLYGALFAAVGSAVDSPAEAQQFMFPITIPLLVSYFGLFIFIIKEHDSPISVWLSIIPFTSPIAMMGRIAFGVPAWQLILSMVLLIGGFIFTTWIAGRIYRVGILMHGTKVNYRVLAKWFLMKG